MALRLGRRVFNGVAAALLAALAAVPVQARISPADMDARPLASVTATSLPAGISKLDHGALAYRPANLPAGPRALVVLLHGMRGVPGDMIHALRDEADRRGLLLVAMKSRDITWDSVPLKLRQRDARGPLGMLEFHSAADVQRMDEVLNQVFAAAAVDPKQIALLGFSDGASVALSMGPANTELFRALIGLSPGFIANPSFVPQPQKIFIAHGERDPILPIRNAIGMSGYFKGLNLDVRFHRFRGGHRIDEEALAKALDFAFPGTAAPVPAGG